MMAVWQRQGRDVAADGGIRSSKALVAACALWLSACAAGPPVAEQARLAAPVAGFASGLDDCITALADSVHGFAGGIDPSAIELVNWNVRKGRHDDWAAEFNAYAVAADIATLQEAPLNHAAWSAVEATHALAFAPGFVTRRSPTGVMTLSESMPLRQCNLSSREPLLRSPKAMLVTEYALLGEPETLLVVNIHAVNFAPGLKAFRAQLGVAARVIEEHGGPVIFAGDFNTWRPARRRHVDRLLGNLRLAPVGFVTDERKRFFGQALDHVYVRGLSVTTATSYPTRASDHTPMRVRLSM